MITDNFDYPATTTHSSLRFKRGLEIIVTALLGLMVSAALVVGVVQPASAQLQIEQNKGRLIRLPSPASSVFIANPAIADIQVKSPTLVYLFGKTIGETTMIAVSNGDKVVLNRQVSVTHNLSRMRSTINALMPGNTVRIRSANRGVVVSGTVRSPMQAATIQRLASQYVKDDKDVVNQLSVTGPTQVNLRVKVLEVSRSVMRQIGINWDAVFSNGTWIAGLATGLPTTISGLFPPATPIRTRNNQTNSIFGNFTNGNVSVSAVIDLLEDRGLIRTLAQPNLTAMSGKSASFLAGGEFPIPVAQDDNTITVEFKQFGVGLKFTPVILDGGRIHLKVEPEVSQLTTQGAVTIQGITVPALTVRRAQTTVELASGQTYAIAGLLQTNQTKDLGKVPGIGNIPILGKLFQSENFQKNETELVIMVTPYIVKPISSRTTALRGRVIAPHNDARRIILGHQASVPSGAPQKLHGPVGFVLE